MPQLSIIIPCYNEEKRLPATLKDIAKEIKRLNLSVEILVVDDGSKDRTAQKAQALQTKIPELHVIHLEPNQGKGHAVRNGMLAGTGQYLLFMDADNSTPLREIEQLWPYRNKYEVIIGSRHLKTSNVVIKQPWYRILISRIGNAIIQTLLIRGVHDTQCGFKLFQKKAAKEIFTRQRTNGFGFDVELLTIAQNILGYRIKEVPVSWYNSTDSRVRPIHDAWRTLKELIRIKYHLAMGTYKKSST